MESASANSSHRESRDGHLILKPKLSETDIGDNEDGGAYCRLGEKSDLNKAKKPLTNRNKKVHPIP